MNVVGYNRPMDVPHPADATHKDEPVLIYDGQCPVCTTYSRAVEIDEENSQSLRRIDARSDDALVRLAEQAGLDLDEGMVLLYGGRHYHGADALHLMARLAPNKGFRNRLNKLLFGSEKASRLAYPILKRGRNALLWMLRRKKIRDMHRPSRNAAGATEPS
jgi:predicted DCC family thiol-disulfide oxidoreductase YuxK